MEQTEDRCVLLGRHIIENKATVRSTGAQFGISKSTVHKDVAVRLKQQNGALYAEVRKVLEQNKAERHLRGGSATREKYKKIISLKRGSQG